MKEIFLLLIFCSFCFLFCSFSIAQDGTIETTSTIEQTTTTTMEETTTSLETTIETTTTQPESTTTIETTTTLPTCDITTSPNVDFGSMNPGVISEDQSTTISNNGNTETTSLEIKGTDWGDSGTNSFGVGYTHWSLNAGQEYVQMNDLDLSPGESLGTNASPGSPLTVFFKLNVPIHQANAIYAQTITFTGSC